MSSKDMQDNEPLMPAMSEQMGAGMESDTLEPEFSQDDLAFIDQAANSGRQHRNTRAKVGAVLLAGAGLLTAVEATDMLAHARFTYRMPFSQEAQNIISSVDDGLATVGEFALPLSLATIGAVKLGSSKKNKRQIADKLSAADELSSQEQSADTHKKVSTVRKGLRIVFAGGIPAVAAFGAGFATFSAALGTEITNGPERILQAPAFGQASPGDAWIVQDKYMNPMLTSSLTPQLGQNVLAEATKRHVPVAAFNLSLGDIFSKGQDHTSLALGVFPPKSSPISWELPPAGCTDATIPIAVDSTSPHHIGDTGKISGVNFKVVEYTKDLSAINRDGAAMDITAMSCITKSENLHAITLETSVEKAQEILKAANTEHEVATVITREQYIANSTEFWKINSKPNTNTLASAGLLLAGFAMSSMAGTRLLRNNRQWATKLGNRVNEGFVVGTETLRATKDGVVAGVVGVASATVLTPLVNAIETGFRAGVGYKEAMVGFGVATLGSVGGTLIKVARPRKVINVPKSTRI